MSIASCLQIEVREMVSIEFDKETEKDVFRLVTMSKEVSLKIVVTLEAMEVVFFLRERHDDEKEAVKKALIMRH